MQRKPVWLVRKKMFFSPDYCWIFRPQTTREKPLLTYSQFVNHTYRHPGNYTLVVHAINGAGSAFKQLTLTVYGKCSSPSQCMVGLSLTVYGKSFPSPNGKSFSHSVGLVQPVWVFVKHKRSQPVLCRTNMTRTPLAPFR